MLKLIVVLEIIALVIPLVMLGLAGAGFLAVRGFRK